MDSKEINQRIWLVVASIPEGKVATYGDVASAAGLPGAARRVGPALKALAKGSSVPWHRVINASGQLSLPAESPSGKRQRARLEEEGVVFGPSGRINLKKFRWQQ